MQATLAARRSPRTAAPPERRIIERPRLLKQLDETSARTILLIAPAGYGKTTLARQFARGRSGLWWYTARFASGDLAQVAAGLAEALDPIKPGFQAYVTELLGALANPARQSNELIDGFTAGLTGAEPAIGVIDDYHLLAESRSAEDLIHALQSRVGLRLLISSRVRPEWAAARDQVYGELVELTRHDLALTTDESTEVLGPENGRRGASLIAGHTVGPLSLGSPRSLISRIPRRRERFRRRCFGTSPRSSSVRYLMQLRRGSRRSHSSRLFHRLSWAKHFRTTRTTCSRTRSRQG
jgi:ATP/maltotriose-dependent transcriptional regulator MalT